MNNTSASNYSSSLLCAPDRMLKKVFVEQILLTIVILLLMSGNILIILVSIKSPFSPNRVYISLLAGLDFAICVQYVLVTIVSTGMGDYPQSVHHPAQVGLTYILEAEGFISLLLLGVVAFDRYVAVCHPSKATLNKTQVTKVVFGILVGGVSTAILLKVIFKDNYATLVVFFTVVWILCGLFMLFCYTRLSWDLYKRVKMKVVSGVASVSVEPCTVAASPGGRGTFERKTSKLFSLQFPDVKSSSSKRLDAGTSRSGKADGNLPVVTEQGATYGMNRPSVSPLCSTAGMINKNREMYPIDARRPPNTNQGITISLGRKTNRTAHLIRTSGMLFLVTFLFFVFWAPFVFMANGVEVPCASGHLFVLNSVGLANPVVFITMSSQIRKDVVKVVTCRKL